VHRQKHRLDRRLYFFNLLHGIDSVEHRHGYVDNDDIGPQLFGSGDQLTTVCNNLDDVKILAEQPLQPFGEDFMIVGDQNP
jgi:hypothetical protein